MNLYIPPEVLSIIYSYGEIPKELLVSKNLDEIRELVKIGYDPNVNYNNRTPILLALNKDDFPSLQLFLSRGERILPIEIEYLRRRYKSDIRKSEKYMRLFLKYLLQEKSQSDSKTILQNLLLVVLGNDGMVKAVLEEMKRRRFTLDSLNVSDYIGVSHENFQRILQLMPEKFIQDFENALITALDYKIEPKTIQTILQIVENGNILLNGKPVVFEIIESSRDNNTQSQDLEILGYYLDTGVNPDIVYKNKSLLDVAIATEWIPFIVLLLSRGAKIQGSQIKSIVKLLREVLNGNPKAQIIFERFNKITDYKIQLEVMNNLLKLYSNIF